MPVSYTHLDVYKRQNEKYKERKQHGRNGQYKGIIRSGRNGDFQKGILR